MKIMLNRKAYGLLLGMFSFILMGCLMSCEDDKEQFNIVDLRYNPEDAYLLPASSPEPITFQVKSNFPWTVSGKADWYVITPASGVPDSIYLITIVAQENTNLDDRIDTVTIKSDYWIGKQFKITQKGIAWLKADHANDTIMSSGVDRKTFKVTSNQNWSCEVTGGSEWLSIVEGATGSIDGQVTVECKENKGELRNGVVTVFDRHHVPAATITYAQSGMLLIPEKVEFRESYKEHDLVFEVNSNTNWVIEKSEYDVWYTITSGIQYNGTSTVTIHLDANSGVSLRKSEITLKTVSDDESVNPVVKTIMLKQAPTPEIEHVEMNSGFLGAVTANGAPKYENGDMICAGSGQNRVNIWLDRLGTHSFRIKQMDVGSSPCWYMIDGWTPKEIRYFINTTAGKTDISLSGQVTGEIVGTNLPLDVSQPHTLTITTSDENGAMRFEWALDDVPFASCVATNIASNTRVLVYLGSNNGNCIWDWYEYYPLVDWDN